MMSSGSARGTDRMASSLTSGSSVTAPSCRRASMRDSTLSLRAAASSGRAGAVLLRLVLGAADGGGGGGAGGRLGGGLLGRHRGVHREHRFQAPCPPCVPGGLGL